MLRRMVYTAQTWSSLERGTVCPMGNLKGPMFVGRLLAQSGTPVHKQILEGLVLAIIPITDSRQWNLRSLRFNSMLIPFPHAAFWGSWHATFNGNRSLRAVISHTCVHLRIHQPKGNGPERRSRTTVLEPCCLSSRQRHSQALHVNVSYVGRIFWLSQQELLSKFHYGALRQGLYLELVRPHHLGRDGSRMDLNSKCAWTHFAHSSRRVHTHQKHTHIDIKTHRSYEHVHKHTAV